MRQLPANGVRNSFWRRGPIRRVLVCGRRGEALSAYSRFTPGADVALGAPAGVGEGRWRWCLGVGASELCECVCVFRVSVCWSINAKATLSARQPLSCWSALFLVSFVFGELDVWRGGGSLRRALDGRQPLVEEGDFALAAGALEVSLLGVELIWGRARKRWRHIPGGERVRLKWRLLTCLWVADRSVRA